VIGGSSPRFHHGAQHAPDLSHLLAAGIEGDDGGAPARRLEGVPPETAAEIQ